MRLPFCDNIFWDVALHGDLADLLAGLGDVVGVLHPHQRLHRGAERLLDADGHFDGEGLPLVEERRQSWPGHAQHLGGLLHGQAQLLDDLDRGLGRHRRSAASFRQDGRTIAPLDDDILF